MSLRISCCTWNVYGQAPGQEDLHEWLNLSDSETPDICAIGLQEVSADPQSLLLDYYIRTDPWTKRLKLYMGSRGLVVVDVIRMMGLLLVVAVRSVHLPFVRNISKTHIRTALWGLMGFKGALGIRFELYGESYCFINAHLVSGEGYWTARNVDFETIIGKLFFTTNGQVSRIDTHRYVFFIGDLNYRIDSLNLDEVKAILANGDFKQLMDKDELLLAKANGSAFSGFYEMEVQHPPTYKYNLGSSDFDTRPWNWLIFHSVKARKPAWCDRVLWRENPGESPNVVPLSYNCHMGYMISDHKPVSANFDVINKEIETCKPTVEFRFDASFVPWTTEEDGVCIFHVYGYKTSSWDWIGLYRLDFNHALDYYTYEWSVTGADETGEDGCMVLFDDVPDEPGFYMFGYYSRRMQCFLGISEPFEVILQPEEPQEVTVDVPPAEDPPNTV